MADNKSTVEEFWKKINEKRWDDLADFFTYDAKINWPNTSETFEVSRFVSVNKHYPGDWKIAIEKVLSSFNTVISVVLVNFGNLSFHAVSFFYFVDGKIVCLEEYWGDDGEPPLWREQLK